MEDLIPFLWGLAIFLILGLVIYHILLKKSE